VPLLVIAGVDIVALLVAIAVLLVLGAFWVFGTIIERVIGHVPIVGGAMGHVFTDYLSSVIQSVIGGFDALTHSVAHYFWAFGVGVWHLTYKLVQAIADAKSWAISAYAHASGLFGTAEGDITASLGQALAATAAAEAFAVNVAENLFSGVESDISGLLDTAEAFAVAQATTVLHDAEDLFNRAEADTAGILSTAEAFAQSAASTVLDEAAHLYNEGIAYTNSVADVLNADIDAVIGEATSVAESAAAVAAAAAAAGVLAQVLPRVVALEAEAAECLAPLCDTITPNAGILGNLGSLLGLLGQAATWALLVELLVGAATDPAAAVADLQSTIVGPINAIARDVSDLIGV
jgi:hypothetical protein